MTGRRGKAAATLIIPFHTDIQAVSDGYFPYHFPYFLFKKGLVSGRPPVSPPGKYYLFILSFLRFSFNKKKKAVQTLRPSGIRMHGSVLFPSLRRWNRRISPVSSGSCGTLPPSGLERQSLPSKPPEYLETA